MRPESMSKYFSELVGYSIVLSIPLFINRATDLQKIVKAFIVSSVFVYLGAFWHLYNYYALGQYVTDIPFWHTYTTSEYTLEYMKRVHAFSGFPRFTLPFASPAGTGLYLSMVGILLLALALSRIAHRKGGVLLLVLFNVLNLFCLLGTFARASWGVFVVGGVVVLWYFRKTFGSMKIILPASMLLMLLWGLSLTPISNEFYDYVGLRFNTEATRQSNAGHLESRIIALEYSMENPIFGLGIGGFFLKPLGGIHTHSTYFTLLVDRGIVGLLLYLWFFIALLRVFHQRLRALDKSDRDDARPYFIGLLGCLVGLLVGNFLYQMDSEVVWLVFGIVLGYVRLTSMVNLGNINKS